MFPASKDLVALEWTEGEYITGPDGLRLALLLYTVSHGYIY
jgi:hypothetical protein